MNSPNKRLLALDIETAPQPNWINYEKASLDFNRNQVTLYSTYGSFGGASYRDISRLSSYSNDAFICHSKFDFKTLIAHKAPVSLHQYEHDTMLMAVAYSQKVPQSYLDEYETRRKELNKLAKREIHRKAKGYSLKVLAPYFLGVEPFWEVEDHTDEAYNLKDTEYTYKLYEFFEPLLKEEGTWDFYLSKLMPWSHMLLRAELRGMAIDFPLLNEKETEATTQQSTAESRLKELWAPVYQAYQQKQEDEITTKYRDMTEKALSRMAPSKKKDPLKAEEENRLKISSINNRYWDLRMKALRSIEPLNLASPTQLTWVLKEQLGLDITEFSGEDESTGKAVLERLAGEGREDIKTFLDYRRSSKLVTSFFPTYRTMSYRGRLHCSFNLNGARTGRLSCSEPNLQQVPGHLHSLFIGGKGRKIISYDLDNIEPMLLTYFSEDPLLCDLMLTGQSFHDHNVRSVFEVDFVDKVAMKKERDACKEYGLSLLYGAWVYRMHESFTKRGFKFTLKDCKHFYKKFQKDFAGYFAWKEEFDAKLEEGERIFNIFGRPVVVKDSVKMQGVNTYTQGSASDLLVESARRSEARFEEEGLDAHVASLVHDEGLFDSAEKDAVRADIIVCSELSRWELPTPYGIIKTKASGGIADYWRK